MPGFLITALEEQGLNIVDVTNSDAQHAKNYLKGHHEVDAIFTLSQSSGMNITMYEPSAKGAKAASEIQTVLASLNPSAKVNISYVYGSQDQTTFDSLGYVFLALFSFFFVFIISGMALVREKWRDIGTVTDDTN